MLQPVFYPSLHEACAGAQLSLAEEAARSLQQRLVMHKEHVCGWKGSYSCHHTKPLCAVSWTHHK